MNKPANPEPMFRAGESWASDAERRQRRVSRYALLAAAIAAAIAILEAIAIAVMMPLKTVEPYAILVDRQTGHTVLVDPAQPRRLDPDSALSQSFLARYVEARESFDFDRAPEQYQLVMGWSAGPIRDSYARAMRHDNPESPIARYARAQRLSVEILSITPMDADTAMVRFETRVGDRSNEAREAPLRWIALIDYRFVARPMSWREMLDNPLGFEVTSYRRSPEAGTAAAVAAD